MKRMVRSVVVTALLATSLMLAHPVYAESAETLFTQGQTAYNQGQLEQALDYFKQTVQTDPNYVDAYFNIGAIYYNLKRYPEALEAFNQLLQRDPNDQAARYETAKVFQKMGRTQEAIAAFEMIPSNSSRYSKAQANIAELKNPKGSVSPITLSKPPAHNKPANSVAATNQVVTPGSATLNNIQTGKMTVQEFANGFFGPTGVAVDAQGALYVANFSKNTVYKVSPAGEKRLLASGSGINGPVGLTLDQSTGDVYIANHLDNTVSKISQDGKVTVVATGLKKPYNIFLDQARRTLYVSQQETNSIAKIKLN
jgi:hypothetical protein